VSAARLLFALPCFAIAFRDQLHGIAHPNLAVVRIGLESELATGRAQNVVYIDISIYHGL